MNDIIAKIKSSHNILICCHISPDGDAVGSAISLGNALSEMDKNVDIVIPDFPQEFNYLKIDNLIDKSTKTYELGIIVDTSSKDRVNLLNNELDRCNYLIVIDHHATNTMFGHTNYVDSASAACCEIIYDLLNKMNYNIDIDIATSLITGIITDTNGYLNSNTTPRTLTISAALIEKGVNLHQIYYHLLKEISVVGFKLRKIVYDRLELFYDNKIAFSYLTKKDIADNHATSGDYEGMVEIGRAIKDVCISIFIRETDDGYKVSIRTIEGISSASIASHFGGGGHICASGCLIKDSLEEVKKQLLDVARGYLK